MKILVTGATGFVGYNFTKAAVEAGHELVCLVRESSNTGKLKELPVQLITANLFNLDEVQVALANCSPKVVVHCAGSVTVQHLDEFKENNVAATENICEATLANNVKRLVYLSSVDVNSANKERPIKEDLSYLPMSPYAESKVTAEESVIAYQGKGLESVIIRPTTIIGEGEPHGMPILLPLIRKRRVPMPNLKDLKDKIHLVYIGNLVDALLLALDKDTAANQIFNICDKNPSSIREAMSIMVEELACKSPFKVPSWLTNLLLKIPALRTGFDSVFNDWEYDISHAENNLAYSPKVSTDESLRRTVRHWLSENP